MPASTWADKPVAFVHSPFWNGTGQSRPRFEPLAGSTVDGFVGITKSQHAVLVTEPPDEYEGLAYAEQEVIVWRDLRAHRTHHGIAHAMLAKVRQQGG